MEWKLGYGTIGLIALLLCAGLVWYEAANAPAEISMKLSFSAPAPLLNPYPELEGLKIRINSAGVDDLQQLPGIGPEKAQAIHDYIRLYGHISRPERLLEVEGVGEKTLETILPFLVFD